MIERRTSHDAATNDDDRSVSGKIGHMSILTVLATGGQLEE
jgi:hypothetical protein